MYNYLNINAKIAALNFVVFVQKSYDCAYLLLKCPPPPPRLLSPHPVRFPIMDDP